MGGVTVLGRGVGLGRRAGRERAAAVSTLRGTRSRRGRPRQPAVPAVAAGGAVPSLHGYPGDARAYARGRAVDPCSLRRSAAPRLQRLPPGVGEAGGQAPAGIGAQLRPQPTAARRRGRPSAGGHVGGGDKEARARGGGAEECNPTFPDHRGHSRREAGTVATGAGIVGGIAGAALLAGGEVAARRQQRHREDARGIPALERDGHRGDGLRRVLPVPRVLPAAEADELGRDARSRRSVLSRDREAGGRAHAAGLDRGAWRVAGGVAEIREAIA